MQPMPRAPSENTFQVTFKIPDAWIKQADAIAEAMSKPGLRVTRTDALRTALAQGLSALHVEHVAKPRGRK